VIRETGILGRRREQVYTTLFRIGPATAREVYEVLRVDNPAMPQGSVTPRMKEMLRMGVATETGFKVCNYTGRECVAFDVTVKVPTTAYVAPPRAVQLSLRNKRDELRPGLLAAAKVLDDVGKEMMAGGFDQFAAAIVIDVARLVGKEANGEQRLSVLAGHLVGSMEVARDAIELAHIVTVCPRCAGGWQPQFDGKADNQEHRKPDWSWSHQVSPSDRVICPAWRVYESRRQRRTGDDDEG
jgi:hypothetical protein